jgi:hypothetical protein
MTYYIIEHNLLNAKLKLYKRVEIIAWIIFSNIFNFTITLFSIIIFYAVYGREWKQIWFTVINIDNVTKIENQSL